MPYPGQSRRLIIMIKTTMILLVPILILFTVSVRALEKEGMFRGSFGWSSRGEGYEVGFGHQIFLGDSSGAIFNENGGGVYAHGLSRMPGGSGY